MTGQATGTLAFVIALTAAGCCLDVRAGTEGPAGSSAGNTGTTAGASSSGATSTSTSTSTSTGTGTGTTSATGTSSGGAVPRCVIGGQSYPARSPNPDNGTECCNPAMGPTSWTPMFEQTAMFAVGGGNNSGPNDGAVGDLNGDGIADVALTAYVGSGLQAQVWVYLSQPDGGFGGPFVEASDEPGEVWPGGVAIADINRDGRPDLIASTMSSIDVFLNLGGGKFGAELVTPTPSECGGAYLRPADVNGDGWMDVVAITESCGVKTLLNNGLGDGVLLQPSGSFDAKYQANGAIGDFDGSLFPEVAFAGAAGGLAWLANSDGGFAAAQYVNGGPQNIYGMIAFPGGNGSALAVSSDNLLEIYSPSHIGPVLSTTFSVGVSVGDVAAADLDGDGRLDLVVANGWGTGTIVDVLLDRGNGQFGEFGEQDLGGVPFQEIGVGDLDGDGAPDLVVFRGDWEAWINQCGPRAAGGGP